MARKLPDDRADIARLMNQSRIEDLVKLFASLDKNGRETILQGISSILSDKKKAQLLDAIKKYVADTDVGLRDWLVYSVPLSYVAGYNFANRVLSSYGYTGLKRMTVETLKTDPDFNLHLQAVNTAISNSYNYFGNALNGYVKSADTILGEALSQQLRAQIASDVLSNQTLNTIKENIVQTLGDKGFSVLIGRNGREWDLELYAEVTARTQIAETYNQGVVNKATEEEVDIVEVSSHGAEDELCAPHEGELYSLSGKSENYPPLTADNKPPYHPNCKHILLLRPDLS